MTVPAQGTVFRDGDAKLVAEGQDSALSAEHVLTRRKRAGSRDAKEKVCCTARGSLSWPAQGRVVPFRPLFYARSLAQAPLSICSILHRYSFFSDHGSLLFIIEEPPGRIISLLQAVIKEDQEEMRIRMAFLAKKYPAVVNDAKAAD